MVPKLDAIYSTIVHATDEEYRAVADEIRHSLIRTSYGLDDLELLDHMPNTAEDCPLDRGKYPSQAYLVALNTGEIYPLDVYENSGPNGGVYGYTSIQGGFDEISRTQMTFFLKRDLGYSDVFLSRCYGILSYQRMKENFCEACIHQLVHDLHNAGAGELALFNPATHEILPVSEGQEYTIGEYHITCRRDTSNTDRFNSYKLRVDLNG